MQSQSTIATFVLISETSKIRPIQLVCNQLIVQIDNSPKKSPKYKKVGKSAKALLLQMVDSGSSIVSASTKIGINYSTAKSIIQARNKDQNNLKGLQSCLTDDSQERLHAKNLASSV